MGRFGSSSDYIARCFDKFYYAIDSNTKFLHMYKEQEQEWTGTALADLGINEI
jgi:hypothetical protein